MPKVGMQPIRRQQLIEATLAAINDVGMHDASIVQIARRAGVSNGIISHYFRDKNGLLEATMRYLISHLGLAVKSRLLSLTENTPRARLRAIVQGNFDDSQTNSAAMKTWLAFWASSLHSPMLHRLQQVNDRRLYSNLSVEFSRCLPKDNARIAAKGLAGLIDGLWLRGALSHNAFNCEEALSITYDYIDQQLTIDQLLTRA
ncbi:transcriptional regulator BetI [Pectobacterium peruviense]|uniref:transcriptional regulator BetI n=1 Tax=Pectobacterium peruviense TaxID=2066479 RepID=UPI000DE3B2DA|nr:transcriptional regulator BetI [Pectobacterium peruviense]